MLFNTIKEKLRRTPAIVLLIFVYIGILPHCLSYQNSWVQPEELYIKSFVLKTGPDLNVKDIKNGLFWQLFEYKPRCTRPLSSYFEIIDTKFRCWLWRYIMPHPSLSLTWIFSLILGPLFLYRLLKNIGIGPNIAMSMVAFYLATPGVLSIEAMLFRPAKPMTNFFIIFCLYLASKLKKDFLDAKMPVPIIKFLICWAITAASFYWDETALLIFPAVLFIFPSLFRRKSFLFLWLLLPLITVVAYLKIIPYLCVLAGHEQPHLLNYDLVQSIHQPHTIYNSIQYLGMNARNLILETMGIFSFSNTSSKFIALSMGLAIASWLTIFFYILRTKKKFDPLLVFLILLLFFFNTMMSVTMFIWGPYYYGAFWSIFFVIFLSKYIERSNIPKLLLLICTFFIIISTTNSFIGTNIIYKKYHWYPYSPDTIEDYFKGTRLFFDKRDTPVFSDKEIKSSIYNYWTKVRKGTDRKTMLLPRELGWLPIEIEPTKNYQRSIPGALFKSTFRNKFTDGADIFDWLVQKGYLVKYPPASYFIKEDIETTITSGLKQKYPDRWEEILNILKETQLKQPYFYSYIAILNTEHNRLMQGIADYSMAIETDPNLAEAYNNRANIYFKLGDLSGAIADYTKAVDLKPGYEDAYYNLGFAYYKQGNLPQAIFNYSKAIEINPKDTVAYDNRAIIYYQLKEYDKAWEDVHKMQVLGTAVNPELINALTAARHEN